MGDDEQQSQSKMMRPNDLCTAAYYGDVEKLKELLAAGIEPVEEEPPLDPEFDPLAPPDEEAAAAAADRKGRREANAKELAKRLAAARKIVTRLSVVNTTEYGFFVTATEELDAHGHFSLISKFKTSKRSTIAAPPLHWAVLGREHAAVEYLVMQGADPSQKIPELDITVDDIVETNQLLETRNVLTRAVASYQQKMEKQAEADASHAAALHARDEARRHAQEEIKRKEEEERLEAERQAALEAAGVAPDGDAAPEDAANE